MKKILIVDDDMDISSLYKERLEIEGFEVKTITDGQKAIGVIERENFDLILLDIMMPKLGGMDVLDFIKNKTETKNIPVIMMTVLVNDEPQIESLKKGADDFAVKTKTTPKELVEKIKKLI